jgi:hypothetical protein
LVAVGVGGEGAVAVAVVAVRVVVVAAEVGVPHHHEFEEEHEEDGHEGDTFGPRVRRDDAGQTLVARRWMKAVATITPDPKYFATKKTHDGTSLDLLRFANVGKMAPICC